MFLHTCTIVHGWKILSINTYFSIFLTFCHKYTMLKTVSLEFRRPDYSISEVCTFTHVHIIPLFQCTFSHFMAFILPIWCHSDMQVVEGGRCTLRKIKSWIFQKSLTILFQKFPWIFPWKVWYFNILTINLIQTGHYLKL